MHAQFMHAQFQTAEIDRGWTDHLDGPLWTSVPADRSAGDPQFAMWTKAAARVDFAAVKPHHMRRVAGIYRERRGQPRLMAEV